MPLDDKRLAILKRLRAMDPITMTPVETRLLEDLQHQQGVSSVEDAIAAGGDEDQLLSEDECKRVVPRCPLCKSVNVSGRSTPTGKLWFCLEPECRNSWEAAGGPTLHGAVRAMPAPNPSVQVGPDDYYPSGSGGFRHPLMNYPTEES